MNGLIKIRIQDVYFDITKEGWDNERIFHVTIYNKYTGLKLCVIKDDDVENFIRLDLEKDIFIEIPY